MEKQASKHEGYISRLLSLIDGGLISQTKASFFTPIPPPGLYQQELARSSKPFRFYNPALAIANLLTSTCQTHLVELLKMALLSLEKPI